MHKSLPERNRVLDLLARETTPLHAREIAKRLDVGENLYEGLLRLLDDLAQNGVVSPRGGDRFSVSKTSKPSAGEERTGTMSIAARGFGFVASQGSSGDDVYIPPESLGGAMQGDTVKISVRSRSARGAEGEVVEIVNRAIKRVAGTLRRKGSSAWLEPDDNRIRGPIVLESEIEVVNSTFLQTEHVVASVLLHQFTGELATISGAAAVVTARMKTPRSRRRGHPARHARSHSERRGALRALHARIHPAADIAHRAPGAACAS